jgi:hypothetical protein
MRAAVEIRENDCSSVVVRHCEDQETPMTTLIRTIGAAGSIAIAAMLPVAGAARLDEDVDRPAEVVVPVGPHRDRAAADGDVPAEDVLRRAVVAPLEDIHRSGGQAVVVVP